MTIKEVVLNIIVPIICGFLGGSVAVKLNIKKESNNNSNNREMNNNSFIDVKEVTNGEKTIKK